MATTMLADRIADLLTQAHMLDEEAQRQLALAAYQYRLWFDFGPGGQLDKLERRDVARLTPVRWSAEQIVRIVDWLESRMQAMQSFQRRHGFRLSPRQKRELKAKKAKARALAFAA